MLELGSWILICNHLLRGDCDLDLDRELDRSLLLLWRPPDLERDLDLEYLSRLLRRLLEWERLLSEL